MAEKPRSKKMAETYEFHPVADLFPMMNADDFEVFCLDIAMNGLREPILLAVDESDGREKIADGRNRYNACRSVNVEPRFRKWDGEGSLLTAVVSLNLKRRHLDETQRAMVAAKLANMQRGRNANTARAVFVSQAVASKILNVSTDSVSRAAKIQKEGVPELIEMVERGSDEGITVSEGAKIASLTKHRQKQIVKGGRKAARQILRKLTEKNLKRAVGSAAVCLLCGPGIVDTPQNFSAAIQLVGERFPTHSRYLTDVVEEMAQEDLSDTTRKAYDRILEAIRAGDAEHNDCRRATGLSVAEFDHTIATMLDYEMIEPFYQGGKTETARGARKKIYRIRERSDDGDLTYEMFDDESDEELFDV